MQTNSPLISGDEDLTAAVEMAQEELCNVVVYYVSDNEYGIYGSKKLCSVASDRVRMDLAFLRAVPWTDFLNLIDF